MINHILSLKINIEIILGISILFIHFTFNILNILLDIIIVHRAGSISKLNERLQHILGNILNGFILKLYIIY